jgi:hypothetical protein
MAKDNERVPPMIESTSEAQLNFPDESWQGRSPCDQAPIHRNSLQKRRSEASYKVWHVEISFQLPEEDLLSLLLTRRSRGMYQ